MGTALRLSYGDGIDSIEKCMQVACEPFSECDYISYSSEHNGGSCAAFSADTCSPTTLLVDGYETFTTMAKSSFSIIQNIFWFAYQDFLFAKEKFCSPWVLEKLEKIKRVFYLSLSSFSKTQDEQKLHFFPQKVSLWMKFSYHPRHTIDMEQCHEKNFKVVVILLSWDPILFEFSSFSKTQSEQKFHLFSKNEYLNENRHDINFIYVHFDLLPALFGLDTHQKILLEF